MGNAETIKILRLAERNSQLAEDLIRQTGVKEAWESVGAEVRRVGSLAMGLLMKHRDIDFHIYSSEVRLTDGFSALSQMAERSTLKRVECRNLLDTEEECIEWHAWCEDEDGAEWQIDMIHIRSGSRYDGFFEDTAHRIREVLTPETRSAILQLKYDTPADEHIAGIEYYQAVLRDGVRTFLDFQEWRKRHPIQGIVEWKP